MVNLFFKEKLFQVPRFVPPSLLQSQLTVEIVIKNTLLVEKKKSLAKFKSHPLSLTQAGNNEVERIMLRGGVVFGVLFGQKFEEVVLELLLLPHHALLKQGK